MFKKVNKKSTRKVQTIEEPIPVEEEELHLEIKPKS